MTPKPDNPIVCAIVSDQHFGSTIGLSPPKVNRDDGGYYTVSPAQRWMWRNYLEFCGKVHDTVKRNKAQLVVISNGDMIDGNHHRTTQSITGNESTMMRYAAKLIEPLAPKGTKLFIIRGTEVHVGGSGRMEEKIAEDLDAVKDGKNWSWWHLPLNLNGTVFDIAHHGSLGRLPWTKPNAVNRIAASVIVNYAETGHRPPDVVIRSHLHQYADTGQNFNVIRVIATPGWQLATAYIHRIAPGAVADTGGLIFTCYPGGEYDLEVVRYRPSRRRPVKVTA